MSKLQGQAFGLASESPKRAAPAVEGRPLRYTLCTTLRCNLACAYCYVNKNCATMSVATARRSLDFLFRHAPSGRPIEIGFFGGEPLLEFPLLQTITDLIQNHPAYDPARVSLALTTNGTLFTDGMADFLKAQAFKVCVSCDGPPHVQDLFRRTGDGAGTAATVEQTLKAAQEALPQVLVNAVYPPRTFRFLPETVEYLSGLGLRQIFLNPDYSASWSQAEADELPAVYQAVANRYIDWYLRHTPHYVSLIDNKIAVLIRGGYQPVERCQMGTGELAIAPDGGNYSLGTFIRGGPIASVGCPRDGPPPSLRQTAGQEARGE